MHLKNWSSLYPDGTKPALAPAYDYVCTLPYLPSQQLALGFGQSRSMDEITPEQVRRFAQTARLPVSTLWKTLLDTIEQTLQAWSGHSERALLPGPIDKMLDDHLRTVAGRIAA